MSGFNVYEESNNGLTRVIRTEVDLTTLPLAEWTRDELGYRLAIVYSKVDGYGHLTASDEVKQEVSDLMEEIKRRGWDPISNLMLNDRIVGFGWQRGFQKLQGKEE